MSRTEPTIDSVDEVGSTRWLRLSTINYTDTHGVKRKWDVATRTTKQSKDKPDAVMIVPILRSTKSKTLETILVSQFRPPVGRVTLEFPAGLIDKDETADQAALREFKEETGYHGTVAEELQLNSILCMTPGLTDETIQMVVVNVDLDDEKNKNPVQMLEDTEEISLSRVPLLGGLRKLMETNTEEMPIAMLYSFALGLELGLKHGKA